MKFKNNIKKTIIFITHDLDEALRIGDRIALMKDGSIIQLGTPEQIMMKPANEFVEKFVEDVDLSKVLTASHVMKRGRKNRCGPWSTGCAGNYAETRIFQHLYRGS